MSNERALPVILIWEFLIIFQYKINGLRVENNLKISQSKWTQKYIGTNWVLLVKLTTNDLDTVSVISKISGGYLFTHNDSHEMIVNNSAQHENNFVSYKIHIVVSVIRVVSHDGPNKSAVCCRLPPPQSHDSSLEYRSRSRRGCCGCGGRRGQQQP